MSPMVTKVVKLKVDEDDWRSFRVWCAERDLTVPQAVATLIFKESRRESDDSDNAGKHRAGK